MIIEVNESDRPRTVGEKLAEYLSRPPQPILRFYGRHHWEGNTFKFQVRNGMPIPLMYGVYIKANGSYRETSDHIGPFSTDWWRITFDRKPSRMIIQLGLVPFEFQTDRLEVS